jgi:acyl phosphate:glycerol-3-phosphate acyltransferase
VPPVESFQVIAAALGYLLGSVPFGLVLTRLAGHGDIREIGSRSIGATNVLRTGNKFIAFLTLICDSGKGAAAAVLAAHLWGPDTGLIAGFMAVFGHNFPVWLKFRGGKGFATTLGVLLFTAWPVGVAACATWLLVAGMFRYSSLATMTALAAAPGIAYWMNLQGVALMAGGLAVMGIIRHHQNIARLVKGEESKIDGKKSDANDSIKEET